MRYDWRKPMTWPMTRRVFIILLAVTYLPIGYTLYGWGEADAATTAPTVVNFYELPQEVTDARQACYEQEREARDIPADSDAYVAWWNTNKGTSVQREWTAAFEACKTAHPMPGGKWNFAGMTLVRTELWP